jgi:lipopolysaccharide/colanic/teichoic acid biosynthesis glycosyltransferase
MLKRGFDVVSSLTGIILLFPFLLILWICIRLESSGGGFYRQVRVGKNGIDFRLWKFRTMQTGADKKGLLTIGGRDSRVTRIGYYLRKYKLDELPQLINVLVGDMSIVGPRPEVRKYVELYSQDQRKVLSVKPGITDYASIEYSNENELLAKSENPEKTYIEEVLPAKLNLNQKYLIEQGFFTDLKIILHTIGKIASK